MISEKNKKLIVAAVAFLSIGAAYFAYQQWTYVTSDNAQVGGHIVLLAARVPGTFVKVNVEEHSTVKKGEILAELDPADYTLANAQAAAQVASLRARFQEAEVNFKRAQSLFKTQAISQERFDNAQASFKELDSKLKAAESQLEQAQLNLGYTKIVAPADGTIARKSVEVGQTVLAGQALFGFVDDTVRWINANLKETQLENIVIGRAVKIDIDAIPHKTFRGEVESISPSTGAVFSLLPPDNATGNFTKVVQRVPVRIKLNDLTKEDLKLLQVGLSAFVSIRAR